MAFADPKGTALRVGLLISSSENSVTAKFREHTFHALGLIRWLLQRVAEEG
jgi:hypothetical protein